MNLRDLSKPQWDAALNAAKALMSSNPALADDRAAYRNAKAELEAVLPADANAVEIIKAAVRWDMMNGLASSVAMIPGATMEAAR